MNKQQRNYAMAKSYLQLCEDREREKEAAYIRDNGITNKDGTTPEYIWTIENEVLFDSVLEDFTSSKYDLSNQTNEAKRLLKITENNLIDYGLSLLRRHYPEQAAILDKHRNDYKTREKLIDLAFKLDTRTIK